MPGKEERFAEERRRMVDEQIVARGVDDPRVVSAMREVPREAFVPPEVADSAYADSPLPIGEGQTISQPLIVAEMAQLARAGPGDRVLDVGTGSGYGAAVLSRIAERVYTVERHERLVTAAQERFSLLGYMNIDIVHGDGRKGWTEHAPFDAIIVAAGADEAAKPLLYQLAVGGRLVIPASDGGRLRRLWRITRRTEDDYQKEDFGPVAFVPLVAD